MEVTLKPLEKILLDGIAKRLTFFGRPTSDGQKVSVSLCGSVAKEKKDSVSPSGFVAN